jgi:hypothetical protein
VKAQVISGPIFFARASLSGASHSLWAVNSSSIFFIVPA